MKDLRHFVIKEQPFLSILARKRAELAHKLLGEARDYLMSKEFRSGCLLLDSMLLRNFVEISHYIETKKSIERTMEDFLKNVPEIVAKKLSLTEDQAKTLYELFGVDILAIGSFEEFLKNCGVNNQFRIKESELQLFQKWRDALGNEAALNALRYDDIAVNPHLQRCFDFRVGLKEKWTSNTSLTEGDLFPEANPKALLEKWRKDHPNDPLPEGALLSDSLDGKALRSQIAALNLQLKEIAKPLGELPKSKSQIQDLQAPIRLELLWLKLLADIAEGGKIADSSKTLIAQYNRSLGKEKLDASETLRLKDRISLAQSVLDVASSSLEVREGDDPRLAFLGGLWYGTCQDAYSGDYKIGLLNTLVDGKQREIAVYEPGSDIPGARAHLTLVWDAKQNRPALMLTNVLPYDRKERRISIQGPKTERKRRLIVEMAKRKARDMGLDLFTASMFLNKELSTESPAEKANAQLGVYPGPTSYQYNEVSNLGDINLLGAESIMHEKPHKDGFQSFSIYQDWALLERGTLQDSLPPSA